MKKTGRILFSIAILFVLILLSYALDESYLSIAVIIPIVLIIGILQRVFVGVILPSEGLFRYRHIMYGIGYGMMIGLLLFLTSSIRNHSFEIGTFTRWMLISIPMGVIFYGNMISYKFKELKRKTNGSADHQDATSDFAIFRDAENNINRGRLLLSGGKLSFYSSELDGCLFETVVVDLNPVIHQSKFMGIPNGFSLPYKPGWVNVAFPYYWLKIMETERKKAAIQPRI